MGETEYLGRLRERVAFEAVRPLADGLGGVTKSWQPAGDGWAAIEMTAMRDRAVAGQHVHPLRYRIVVRRQDGLNPSWRVKWRNRRLAITDMEAVKGRPDLVLLQAEEETSAEAAA